MRCISVHQKMPTLARLSFELGICGAHVFMRQQNPTLALAMVLTDVEEEIRLSSDTSSKKSNQAQTYFKNQLFLSVYESLTHYVVENVDLPTFHFLIPTCVTRFLFCEKKYTNKNHHFPRGDWCQSSLHTQSRYSILRINIAATDHYRIKSHPNKTHSQYIQSAIALQHWKFNHPHPCTIMCLCSSALVKTKQKPKRERERERESYQLPHLTP